MAGRSNEQLEDTEAITKRNQKERHGLGQSDFSSEYVHIVYKQYYFSTKSVLHTFDIIQKSVAAFHKFSTFG
jgi:hypothetical protein